MREHKTTTSNIESKEQKRNTLKSYTRPTLKKLGTITSLTAGGSGNLGDITGPTTPGTMQW